MSDSPAGRWAIQARLVFPVAGPPLRDGIVTIDGDRIVAVGANTSWQPPVDLGNVAVLPGLVNAHTHLEFSDLTAPLGQPGMPFPNWIRAVFEQRNRRAKQAGDSLAQKQTVIRRGLAESLVAGVTAVGEIATTSWFGDQFPDTKIDCTLFRELLGLTFDRAKTAEEEAHDWLQRIHSQSSHWRPALSPHAPYSVRPSLLDAACRLAAEKNVPVAMHLAESPEELELLAAGTGPFVDLLEQFGAWDKNALPSAARPLDYLRRLATTPRALIIHGNYLSDVEVEFLAAQRDRMSLVYCPRTHAYFGHQRYPLSRYLAAGINVALGTDSRASNPDLNLLSEMRYVARHHAQVTGAEVLRMGTLAGARALGLDHEIGSLVPGKRADLAIVGLPAHDDPDPYAMLFADDEPVQSVILRGAASVVGQVF